MKPQLQSLLKPLELLLAVYGVSTLTSMAGMSVGAGLLGVGMLFLLIRASLEFRQASLENHSQAYFRASLLLAAACVLSLIVAQFYPLSYGGKTSPVQLDRDSAKLWYLFWPLVLAPVLRIVGPRARSNVLRAWLVAFFAISIIGIAQYFTGWPRAQIIPFGTYNRFHATLFFGHHLSTASIWIFPFFVALDLAADRAGGTFVRLPRWFLWVSVALGGAVLFLTFSRMVWLALPIGLLAWVLLRLPRRAAIGTALACVAMAVALYQVPTIHDRLNDAMGTSERFELWRANWEFFKERPLTGVGWRHNQELSGYYLMEKHPGKDVFSGHAHNVPIDLLAGTGALGLLAWLGWLFVVLGRLWSSRRRVEIPFAAGLLCAWLVFLINGLTQVNFWEAKVQHQVAWTIAWALAL